MPAALMFAVASLVVLIPLFGSDLPPLVDYPNHLTRMFLLAGPEPLPGHLSDYYRVHWRPLPNLAMDVIVPLLARFMPLETASKIFLGALLWLNAAGVIALHRALWGKWRIWPGLGILLLYNRIFLWGFVNFLFGLGLAFCTAAAWAAIGPNRPVLRAAIGAVLSTLTAFCHVEAYGILGLIILGMEAGPALSFLRRRQWAALLSRAMAALAAVLPAILLFGGTWISGAAGSFHFSGIDAKLDMLLTVFGNYHPAFDMTATLLFAALFACLAAAGRLTAVPALAWWAGLFGPVYLLLPTGILSGYSADMRLPLAFSMLMVAGTAPIRLDRRLAAALTTITATLFLVRMMLIESVWSRAGPVYAANLEVLSHLPEGAKLAIASPWAILNVTDIPTVHFPTLAVKLRHAYVPTVFAFASQQPLEHTERSRKLMEWAAPDEIFAAFTEGNQVERTRMETVLPKFDYAVFLHNEPFTVPPDDCLTFVAGTSMFQLFRISPRDGVCRHQPVR